MDPVYRLPISEQLQVSTVNPFLGATTRAQAKKRSTRGRAKTPKRRGRATPKRRPKKKKKRPKKKRARGKPKRKSTKKGRRPKKKRGSKRSRARLAINLKKGQVGVSRITLKRLMQTVKKLKRV